MRSPIFDILRLIGALLVIAGHSYALIGREAETPSVFGHGLHTIGVEIFFVISGFLITRSWLSDPHLIRYTVKRIRRIMPALLAVVFLTALVFGPFVSLMAPSDYYQSPQTWTYLWRNSILLTYHFLPGVFSGAPVNGSLWTLPVEAFCYLLTPIILVVFRNRALAATVYLAAASALFYAPFTAEILGFGLAGASSVMPYFWIGAAAYLFGCRLPQWPNFKLPIDLSYGTYLFAFPVQQTIITTHLAINPWIITGISTTIVLPLAWLSWTFVEKPMLTPAAPQTSSRMMCLIR